jgi:hypothetical protein
MNLICVICQNELTKLEHTGDKTYCCKRPDQNQSSHYYIQLNEAEEITYQGYVIGKYFVQAFIEGLSYIFLEDDPKMKDIATIPRALWINSTNLEQTLATVKLMVIMS